MWRSKDFLTRGLKACLHGAGGPLVGEVTCGGSPHLSCKREQIWTGGLPHLSGLPHPPGVPHLQVTRPHVRYRLNFSSFHIYFSARLDFPSPPLSGPGSPRMWRKVLAYKNRTTGALFRLEVPTTIFFEGEFDACNFRCVNLRSVNKSSSYALWEA